MGNKLPWILGAGAVAGGLTAGYLVGKKSAGAKKPQGKALTGNGHLDSPKHKRSQPTSDKPVVIVGGGNAGLAAAYELEKAGVDYILYEASDRLGGRVGLVHVGEYEYATGAGFTEPQWKKTFEYLNEFGMMDKVHRIDRQVYGFWYKGKVHYIPVGGKMDLNQLRQMLSFRGLPLGIIPQFIKFLPHFLKYTRGIDESHDFSSLAELSAMSTAEFGLKYGGEDVVDRVMTPFLGTMVLTNAGQVSIAHPIALMSLMQGMCSIDGGLSSINDEIIKRVGQNCQLNTPVKRVVIEDGIVKGVELADEFVEADQVVLAVDAEVALSIAPDLPASMAAVERHGEDDPEGPEPYACGDGKVFRTGYSDGEAK